MSPSVERQQSCPPRDTKTAPLRGASTRRTLEIVPGPSPRDLQQRPFFSGTPGGSAYEVIYYLGDTVQASVVRPSGHFEQWLLDREIRAWIDRSSEDFMNEEGNSARGVSVGACSWGFAANGNTFTVELADGETLTADRVEFVEVIGDGAYPYLDFSDIDTAGTSGGFSILEESIVQAN